MAAIQSSKTTLQKLLGIHKLMQLVQLVIAIVAFYLVYTRALPQSVTSVDQLMQVLAIAISAGGIYSGSILFKKKLMQARELSSDVKQKCLLYQSACIIHWALLEGPSLFVLTCFIITGNYAFLALAAVLILLFAMMAPSKLKMVMQLQITEAEVAEN